MTNNATIEKLGAMKLHGMQQAFTSSLETRSYTAMTPDEFIALLTEAEWNQRYNRKIASRIKTARFRYPASIESLDYSASRNLDKNNFIRLTDCSFIERRENLIITGPTGLGKSFIASAIGHQACMMGLKVAYHNTIKLFSHLKMSQADRSYTKEILKIEKSDLLILDDFGLRPFDNESRLALLEIIEDRHSKKSTIIASQIPVVAWHELLGEKTIADAILDRLVHTAHRIDLKGDSMRKLKTQKPE